MTLKDVVAVAGKPGLYKILKMTRTGMIIESMDGKPVKAVVNASHRISVLKDISIYTHTQEESIILSEVFSKIIADKGQENIEVDVKDNEALLAFLEEIVPEYDREKVYASDVKKLVNWFNLLLKKAPEVLENLKETTEGEEEVKAVEEKSQKTEEKEGNSKKEEGSKES